MSWSVYIGDTSPGGGLPPTEIKTLAAERFEATKKNFTSPEYETELKTVEAVERLINLNLDYLTATNSKASFALEAYGSITLPPSDPSWNYSSSVNFGVKFTQVAELQKAAESA